jgi:hypothetical protein
MSARRSVLPLSLTFALSACFAERDRPFPAEATPAALSVEVLEPQQGATVIAGRDVTVRVSARDLRGENLAGIGFVARLSGSGGNATLDSVVATFASTRAEQRDFAFHVPEQLVTNVQVDIFGLAFASSAAARVSVPRSVTVARCEPFQPGCS